VSTLKRRLEALERRRPKPETCPTHVALTAAMPFDIREGLWASSPDPEERARYHERMDRLEAQPPCSRCSKRLQDDKPG
jgi:hypothetical protein